MDRHSESEEPTCLLPKSGLKWMPEEQKEMATSDRLGDCEADKAKKVPNQGTIEVRYWKLLEIKFNIFSV